jgi:GNAT superfamily N-acetyltransferase
MIGIRYAEVSDSAFWFSLDKHINENEYILKTRDKRAYIIDDGEIPIGVMRYNLFWDIIPFLTLIYIDGAYHRKGYGRQAMLHWEAEMCSLGYKMVMTSTQSNEQAQYFYRKLGYIDKGCLVLDNTPYEQPQEILMVKVLT